MDNLTVGNINTDVLRDVLPWSEYSTCDVLVFNPSDRRFYTLRDSQWVEVRDVPDDLLSSLDYIAFRPDFSEQGILEYPESMCDGIREILAAPYRGNNGRLPFADEEESDDDIDDILESIRSI